ncbi:YopT-type cysteine protease domain-containing protein [Pasteurella multocida]|uniref:YopT-type cysteine protease domain-containing protein n=2 Tax=Pasteurella multocida TaxID=747 RepID=UPI000D3C75F2|nr:YopT-type cysteine protease domain-containing protein [Pasteurella multocida]AWB54095.1 peptidase C58 [Pasteurella multocida]TCH95799.1 YopT-type cysteine protease domain-containing protein [Pasteurella multocida]WND47334.1 YopT-type cysteine protease domain-containing protein [Pasteurella multocida]WNY73106.1 YopT-type cysteine protease domain-containing protein [Pasteurella multocida]HDR1092892.1 YopT-type cysteine protease domain-containing protein [Pasteurella multocida]
MNKNRYKLIFSQVKGCLVPVAECINSAISNGSSDSTSTSEQVEEEPFLLEQYSLSSVSLLVKSTFNPVSYAMQLTWKQLSILFLSVISVPVLAEGKGDERNQLTVIDNSDHIKLDASNLAGNDKTKIYQAENKVLVIDIAKPNGKGISDNRFEKFNIPNSAVFNNNGTEAQARSTLIGYIPQNQNLRGGKEADVILNQVTGPQESKIVGALEVLGKKADIVIANQNGITLNGVRTINSDRFVATTSELIDPNQMMLKVTKGNVIIDIDGFSTDGLKYLDIIAKKIEQKQSITSGDNSEAKTDVTLIAGSSEYDLSKHELKKTSGENVSNDVIAITGSSTGAMHGKNIKLIVTDKGAGVKHDGIILSENDIQIEMNEGDLELGNTIQQTVVKKDRNIRAKKKIEVKNANRVFVGSQTKSDEISLEAKQVKIRKNAEIRSTTQAKIVAKGALSIEQNAKLVAKKIDVATETLTNAGRIYGREVKLDTNNLINDKEIYAERKLSILTKGKDLEIIQDRYLSPLMRVKSSVRFLGSPFFSISPSMLASLSAQFKPGFVNKGLIESAGSAELTFKEKTSFLTEGNNFIRAKDALTINAQNIEIDKNQDIQLGANITLNVEENFVNRAGTLATGKTLTINTESGSIYNLGGTLGAGKSLKLTAKSTEEGMGNIVNQENGLFHTLGNMMLEAERSVYNIGDIYASKKLTVHTHNLINDVRLSGNVSYKPIGSSRDYDISRVAVHGWHNNVYKLNLNLQEQDKTDIKVVKMGAIRSDGDFDFKGIKATSSESKPQLINHGLINVKGTFNAEADQVVNQMKAFNQNALASVFKNPAKITMYYQPLTRYIWTPLSGNASREFNNLESFLDALFGSTTILKSSFYSTENFSAYQLLSHIQHSPMYQKAMAQVFGAEWHSKSYDEMRNKWKSFKENPTDFIYYPSEKAKILAGKLEGKLTTLQNGEYAERGKFDESIQIGKHQLSLPSVELKAEFSDKERLEEDGVDLSSIAELLEMPNLFIDNSIQLEKKKLSPIEDLDEEPRKNLDIEESHSNSSDDVLSMNDDESDTDDSKWSMGKDEKEMPDDKLGISRDDRGNKPPRTDPTVDYLNPDEFFENGYLLNELLQELGEEPLLKEGEDHFKRSTNLVRLGERDRQNREKREKEGYFDLPGTLDMKLQELFEKRKQKHEAEQKARIEKALLQKSEQQEKRVEERKQEEKRQAQDKIAKQVEIAKEMQRVEEIRQREKQLAIQLQEEEKKQQEEKHLSEEKKQAEQKQKAEEKVAQERLDIEQQKAYEEMAKREAEASKNVLLKAIDEERPKVETDPLFRTKLKYINQDDYAGANYFFNKVGLNTKGHQKVNVLGDNYFDHQVITRSIEKKVDNHLNQKYNLSDVELVKQLMDNSTTQAQELDLKLGAALTKEQQANLTQDIVWYVKTKVKGKDVFVPKVYFASETLVDAQKLQGLGTGTIRVGEAKIKAKDVVNTGTLAGRKLNVEASNKIKNQGSILSTQETRLVGRKGIENVSRSFANDELGVTAQRSEIKTEGHLHLETDKDSTIDVQASDIKAKTSFVKTGDVNLKNTYNTKHAYREKFSPSALQVAELDVAGLKVPLLGVSSPSSYSEHTSEATSEGSIFEVGHLHLAVDRDVNQAGSKIKAKYTTGVVKGNFNTEAGKNIKHVEKEEYSSQLFASAHASGGGTSVRYDYNSQDGGNASVGVPTNHTGVGAEAGMSFTHTKDKETLLTHTNSELQVKHGKLHVLGYADIGGVDINTKLPEDAQSKAQKEIAASKPEKTEQSAQDVAQAQSNANKDKENKAPEIKELSEAEIADLMSEKSKAYFDDFAEQAKKAPENNRFELSAKEIKSSKQKDQYDHESERTTFKVGPEAEAHSAVADMVSHLVKEYRDAQNGTKQDGTVALQHASDVLNIVTGDLAGSSAKLSVERTHETKRTTETGDIVTKIGGNVTLSARSGSVNLKNVQSDEQANLTLRAKEDVNVLSGEKTRETTETVSRQKLSHGVNAGCSMMSGACTAGVSTSLEGNESYTSERETAQNNSFLKARNMKVEAGRDFNVVSSNIDADKLDLHVKGKTNVVSKQDTLQKVTHGVDYNLSAGVALSSATIATPTGNVGFGYTNETESKRTVNQQAGIKANKITGQTHDLNLEGGYLVSNDKDNQLKVTGDVTTKALHDQHDKDGGTFGLSVGISERGTTAFNVRGGRAEQKHYNATQKSTLSGVDTSQANVSGQVNTDLTKAKAVTRDDTYASTQFSFEVADIVELGQRAKNKLSAPNNDTDMASGSTLRSRSTTEEADVPTTRSRVTDEADSVSVKNPIYESADAVVPTPRSRNVDSTDLVDNPLYASATTKANIHDYEEIPAVYSKVGDNNADLVRHKTATSDEHLYAEINEPTYSRVGDKNADMRRHNAAGTTDYADVVQAHTRKADDPLPALPNQGKARTVNDGSEHIYTDISDVGTQTKAIDSTYATVGMPKANAVDSTYATVETPKVKAVETTYATVDMPRAKAVESEYATVAEPKHRKVRNVTDELPALPNESKVRTVNDGSDHTYAEIADVNPNVKRPLPSPPELTTKAQVNNEGDYSTVTMPKATVAASEYATVAEPRRRKVRSVTDELPALPNESKVRTVNDGSDHTYAEIANVNPNVKRPLLSPPELTTKAQMNNEGDYSTVTMPKATVAASEYATVNEPSIQKARNAHDPLPALPDQAKVRTTADGEAEAHVYAEISDNKKAQRPLPDVPDARVKAMSQESDSERDYVTIHPSAKTHPTQEAETNEMIQPQAKAQAVESDYEAIPFDGSAEPSVGTTASGRVGNKETRVEPKVRSASEENLVANQVVVKTEETVGNTQAVAKSKKAEKSLFSKMKDFFMGDSNKEKKTKAKATKLAQENAEAQVNTKPNYESLEDNLNLKNLLDLEGKRNEAFESNVLKNPEFLAEAREAAKKYLPEATIKQMANSPELDDILTEGARKVEKRINDVLTFKPSVEEFTDIQGLVKTLPRGEVIEDLKTKTLSITEALAETSKTIQRNPKLKEEVQGAIEEFLKSSQGQDLTVDMVEKLNHGLRPDEGADRLLYKKETLTKENAVFSSPEAAKIQLGETVDFINKARQQGVEPSVLAGLVYQRLIAYHPFAEGNGRMARVIVNKLLLDAGYPPFTKFNSDFETQIIPQTDSSGKSATSAKVVKKFLTELGKKPLPEVNTNVTSKVSAATEEPVYASVDKRPEALAKANAKADETLATNPIVKAHVEDDVAPELPIRPELKDAAGGHKKVKAQAEKGAIGGAESPSVFKKIKNFFSGSDATKKAEKTTAKKAVAEDKPNYDGLDDTINLKGLVALEDQRNESFATNVLNNAKFLDEAREVAKKSLPEVTIKQMGHLPEFDDILTEGARSIENRINNAVTFKPSAQEFSDIQTLVKQLPKGQAVEDIDLKTSKITDALAETSKTIQRNPELKNQLQGAVETFLQSSQGKNLTVEMIEKLNHGLRPDEGADRLLYKKETLTKENAVFSSPEASRIQLAETVDFINKAKTQGIEPSVLAGLVYQRLIAYHPFSEGNGRMARVIVNKILLDAGYPPFTKFNPEFETKIIPQTEKTAQSATSSEVVQEFLKELGKKGDAVVIPTAKESSQNLVETDHTSTPSASTSLRKTDVVEQETSGDVSKPKPVSERVQQKELVEQSRSVLKQVQDQFQPLKVKHKIDAVRASVAEYGGEVSFKYAQSKGEVYKEIVKHVDTQHGVCESTCAHWIANKVSSQGEDFWNTMYEGGKKGHLKQEAIDSIKKLQTEFMQSGSATQQFKLTDNWLQEQGVVPKEKKVGDLSRRDEVAGTVSKSDISALTKAILDTGSDTAGAKKISINLEGGSHTVSALVQGEKVVFFDPNFGEMTFPSHQKFESWLKEAFWEKSGYAGKKEGKRFFNVVNYHAETK